MNLENKAVKTTLKYVLFFVVTFIFTTIAGAEWRYGRMLLYGPNTLSFQEVLHGLAYSISFLGILTVHEYGHFLTAKFYKIKVTPPFYIPLWFGFLPGGLSLGTIGAFIRIKEAIASRKVYFDIGIAGPLAGFVMAFAVLTYGFTHLPDQDYIYSIHPEYEQFGPDYEEHVYDNQPALMGVGTNLLMEFFKTYVATDPDLVPNKFELIHYPFLFAGYLALIFTAINLIPIGQLDGGHVLYGLIGPRKHRWASLAMFTLFVTYAGQGVITPYDDPQMLLWSLPLYLGFLYILFGKAFSERKNVITFAVGVLAVQMLISWYNPTFTGYNGWLVFAFLLGRVLGIYHPPVLIDRPLSTSRQVLGWIALIIFILCFTPEPLEIVQN